jgi:hypothetical protein
MTVEPSLAAAPVSERAPAPDAGTTRELYSAEWWQRQSADQLRDIINRGFAGGSVFRDAVAEAERRASEETRRLRAVAAAAAASRKKRRQILWGTATSLLIIAVLGFWIAG